MEEENLSEKTNVAISTEARAVLFEKIIERNSTYQKIRKELMEKIERVRRGGVESPTYITEIPLSELAAPGEELCPAVGRTVPSKREPNKKKIRITDRSYAFGNGGVFSSFVKGSEWPGTLFVLSQKDGLEINVTMEIPKEECQKANVPEVKGLFGYVNEPKKFNVNKLDEQNLSIRLRIYVPELDESYFDASCILFDCVGNNVLGSTELGTSDGDGLAFVGSFQNLAHFRLSQFPSRKIVSQSFKAGGIFPIES